MAATLRGCVQPMMPLAVKPASAKYLRELGSPFRIGLAHHDEALVLLHSLDELVSEGEDGERLPLPP